MIIKKCSAIVFLILTTVSVFAQTSNDGYLKMFVKTENAAIPGQNEKHLTNVTLEEAAKACIDGQYLSFDYYKNTMEADLSNASEYTVDGLKTDYKGDPYDHYSYRGGLEPHFFKDKSGILTVKQKGPIGEDGVALENISYKEGKASIVYLSRHCKISDYHDTSLDADGNRKMITLPLYFIQLRIDFSEGDSEDFELFYCPLCDLYYSRLSIMGGLYDCSLHSDDGHYAGCMFLGEEDRKFRDEDNKTLFLISHDNDLNYYEYIFNK